MRMLLTTIKTDCKYTDYAMRYLYSIVEGSPLDVDMKIYGKYELDGRIYEDIITGHYNLVYFHCDALNERHITNIAITNILLSNNNFLKYLKSITSNFIFKYLTNSV